MITYKPIRWLLMMVCCSLVVTMAPSQVGAAGDTFKRSAELAKRTSRTSKDVDKYVAQLDKTEQALSSVSQGQGKDLKNRYESFSKEVDNLEEAQKHATTDNEIDRHGILCRLGHIDRPDVKSRAQTSQHGTAVQSHERP